MPSIYSIAEAARFGLAYERQRMEAASLNLAIANVPIASGDGAVARPTSAQGSEFLRSLGVSNTDAMPAPATKRVYEPDHPMADTEGYVRYADVEPSEQMVTLISATRAYEANVRAFNSLHQMANKALEIGGRR